MTLHSGLLGSPGQLQSKNFVNQCKVISQLRNMARAIQLVGASCDADNIEQQLLAFNMCAA